MKFTIFLFGAILGSASATTRRLRVQGKQINDKYLNLGSELEQAQIDRVLKRKKTPLNSEMATLDTEADMDMSMSLSMSMSMSEPIEPIVPSAEE